MHFCAHIVSVCGCVRALVSLLRQFTLFFLPGPDEQLQSLSTDVKRIEKMN